MNNPVQGFRVLEGLSCVLFRNVGAQKNTKTLYIEEKFWDSLQRAMKL